MARKLYALCILIGVIGALVLSYLYFFVYYTATISVNSNVGEYELELFSKSTAQKRRETCPEAECIIRDVSPFEYNVTFIKEGYETKTMSIDVAPRRRETLFIELSKKVVLEPILSESAPETPREKIERLREANLYYASFKLEGDNTLRFKENSEEGIEMLYESSQGTQLIGEFPIVPENRILADYISGSDSVFLRYGDDSFIFDPSRGKLNELDFEIDISYIKSGNSRGEYIIITEKGAFLYDTNSGDSEFQYLFRDYVYNDQNIIGVIYDDEEQKKKNFNLTDSGNLIIKYTPSDKTRDILYQSTEKIERIEWQSDQIILTVSGKEYELQNY